MQMRFKNIHPQQQQAAKNLIHYLTLRNEDIRELQDMLHIHGLSSLASSESHTHSQVQSILQRLGKNYSQDELDTCTYEFNLEQIGQKSKILFGEKNDAVTPYIMVTFDSSFVDNYALIKNLLQNGMNVARINCAHDDEATWSRMIQHIKKACRHTGLHCKIYMDLAGPRIRTRLMNKGKEKGKVKVKEGELVWLADDAKSFKNDEIVISPHEAGIIAMLKKGERVYIDDGMVKGVVETITKKGAAMRIIRISSANNKSKKVKESIFPIHKFPFHQLLNLTKHVCPLYVTMQIW